MTGKLLAGKNCSGDSSHHPRRFAVRPLLGQEGRRNAGMPLKVLTLVGTRPELIKLSRVIAELDRRVSHVLVHTGQNYDYELNEIFFKDLGIRKPDHFLECAAPTPAETIANVIA